MIVRLVVVLLLLAGIGLEAAADELRPGYLEIRQTGEETFDVGWKVPAVGDRRLSLYVRFPAGAEIVEDRGGRFEGTAFVERWQIRHPGGLAGQTIYIDGLNAMSTDVLVRAEFLDGSTLVDRLNPSRTGVLIEASPDSLGVAVTYLVLGVEHILLGIDHLLFVLALLLLVRGMRRLIGTITAFTVAHSITLAAATLGWVSVPIAPVEAVIALSIVFVAAEIVHSRNGRDAFSFGLLHGFGFAGALSEVGLPGNDIPVALLFFNVGVEIGQLIFVVAFVTLVALLRRPLAAAPRWLALTPAYAIGALATFWMLQRVVLIG